MRPLPAPRKMKLQILWRARSIHEDLSSAGKYQARDDAASLSSETHTRWPPASSASIRKTKIRAQPDATSLRTARQNRRKNLRRANPDCLRQSHFLHVHHARPCENGVNDPHNDSTDEKRQSYHPEILQILADLFRKGPRRNRSHNKCYERETQWVR